MFVSPLFCLAAKTASKQNLNDYMRDQGETSRGISPESMEHHTCDDSVRLASMGAR
jgi:hypothetical protein